jgi:single-stranded DNA-specific DHH superfamily exonuclease
MLSQNQIKEIREHFEKAQNPVVFFDNDCDGLMSFVMLRKYLDRGKGVPVRSSFEERYAHKVWELDGDYVFILDRPNVSKGFIEEVVSRGIPIIWIDHHDVAEDELVLCEEKILLKDVGKGLVNYYNPGKNAEPVSYLMYNILNNKSFQWIAMVGCIADNFIPDFEDEFVKNYPELWKKGSKEAFEIFYESDLGKIINLLDFALKDKTSSVISMINFLIKINSPFELLKEDSKNSLIHKRYSQVESVYSKLIEKAKNVARRANKVVFFEYGGNLSLSANIANELSYRFPGKIIIVAFVRGDSVNISVRGGINVREIALEAIKEIPGAQGGGHENAVGAKMSVGDLKKFRDFFVKSV